MCPVEAAWALSISFDSLSGELVESPRPWKHCRCCERLCHTITQLCYKACMRSQLAECCSVTAAHCWVPMSFYNILTSFVPRTSAGLPICTQQSTNTTHSYRLYQASNIHHIHCCATHALGTATCASPCYHPHLSKHGRRICTHERLKMMILHAGAAQNEQHPEVHRPRLLPEPQSVRAIQPASAGLRAVYAGGSGLNK